MESPDEECHVIHEADNPDLDENLTLELYDTELEFALKQQYPMIVIEPKVLGDQVSKRIQVGKYIHKSAVLCSLGCLVSPLVLPSTKKTIISMTLGGSSLLLTAIYNISWQFDPCSKYQVEYDIHNLVKVPLERLTSQSPIVLIHKDDRYRKSLHNVASLAALVYMGYKAYLLWDSLMELLSDESLLFYVLQYLVFGPFHLLSRVCMVTYYVFSFAKKAKQK